MSCCVLTQEVLSDSPGLLGVLAVVMAYRYSLAFKFMPAGLVAVLSFALFVHNFVRRASDHKTT